MSFGSLHGQLDHREHGQERQEATETPSRG